MPAAELPWMPEAEAPIDDESRAEAQLPWQFRQWPALRYELREWWSLEHGFGSGDMKMGSLLDVSLFLSSLLLFFGSWPGINGVGTGFTTSGSQSMGGRVSPCTGSTERSPWAVLISCGTYGFVRLCMWNGYLIPSFHFFPFLLLYGIMQPRRSAPKEGDNVTAPHVTCPGPGNARWYSWLATSLRSLAIILSIHLHLQSLESTCATIIHSITVRKPT